MAQSVTLDISVLAFAAYADRLGWRRQALSVAAGSTVADVVSACRHMPGGSVLPASPLVARNARFVTLEEPVTVGDEIALMPPVAGG
jgi:molybdopterin converting factor small subunit